MALNCWLTSRGSVGFTGEMVSAVAVADVMVREVVALIDPVEAVMVTLPDDTPRVSPLVDDVSPIVAMALFEELQLTLEVMF